MRYTIHLSPEALDHLSDLKARDQSLILDHVEKHLQHHPDVETRRRKRLRPNPRFPWELRIQVFRVFYDIEGSTVIVLATGHKKGNQLIIAGKEIEL